MFGSFSATKPSEGNEEVRCATALWLVYCGELSRASRVVTSDGLGLSSADTAKKLALKHPRVKNIDLSDTSHCAGINLSKTFL